VNSELFTYSLRYVEELHNKLFGSRFSKDDFEQLNVLYDLKNLKSNLDLEDLYEKLEELIVHVTQEKVDEVEKESAELLESYTTHYQSVFLVDGFAYTSIAEALKHALVVYTVVNKNKIDQELLTAYPKLKKILSRSTKTDSIIDGWYFNANFFAFNPTIFQKLDLPMNTIRTNDKELSIKSINFLEAVYRYQVGERINEIESVWRETNNGKKRWQGKWIKSIVDGNKGEQTHNFDWISDTEVIYQNTYGVALSGGSETSLYQKDNKGNWQKIKSLQKLIG
jgi:hypothetical protein